MNRKKYWYAVLFTSLLLFSACYDDNNTYKVNSINEAVISTSSDSYTIQQLGELSISPEIKYTLDDNASYSYEWKVFEPKEYSSTNKVAYGEVIATTKDLKEVISSPAGEYVLLYTVINNHTGVKNFKELKLTVNSAFNEGLVIAYNKEDNSAELGFIRTDDKINYDLIRSLNKTVINDKAEDINTLIVKSLRLISFTTSNNHFLLDADEFVILGDKTILFSNSVNSFGSSYFGGNKMYGYDAPSDIFYINAGKIFADIGPDFGGNAERKYSQAFYYSEGDYDLYPFLFNGEDAATIFFYDNLNQKFLQSRYNARTLSDVTMAKADNFDPSDIGKTAIGAMLGYENNVYYIMKDGQSYYVYVMMQYAPAIANNNITVDQAKNPHFSEASIFDARTDLQCIYYAVKDKLYKYDLKTNSSDVVLTLNNNEQIADILVYKAYMWQNSTDENFDKRIYIAANNGKQGKIYQYGLSADGSLSGTPEKEFSGFGTIVGIDYRNKNE